jgi:pyruvate/2-oxoglutarate dehydrogenase complex dihydrolipoamide acyltransferase (E2) component
MTIEVTEQEAEIIRYHRLTPDQRNIENLAKAEAQRQKLLEAMKPADAEAYVAAEDERKREQARIEALPAKERKVEMLLKRKASIAAEAVRIVARDNEIDLAQANQLVAQELKAMGAR